MRKIFFVTLLVFHSLATSAIAQETFGFEVGPYAGPVDWRSRNFQVGPPQASPPIQLGFDYKSKPVYGGRFNLLSSGYWGGELSYSYQSNTVTISRPSFTPVELKGGIHQFFYNTVLYPFRYRSSRVMPFVTAGIGMAGYKLSDDARRRAADPKIYGLGNLKSIDERFAFNYGGGVKFSVLSHLGLRFDFRHNFSDVPSYGLPKESSNPAQTVLPIQGKLQNYEGSVGIYFHFLK
jgi:opacity protein-like surface antigen